MQTVQPLPTINPTIKFLNEKLGWLLGILHLALLVGTLFYAIPFTVLPDIGKIVLMGGGELLIFALIALISSVMGVYQGQKKSEDEKFNQFVTGEATTPAASAAILSFEQLFRRNLLIAIIFLPVFVLAMFGFTSGLVFFREHPTESKSAAKFVISLLMFGVVTFMGGGFWLARRIATASLGEASAISAKEITSGVGTWGKNIVIGIFGHLLFIVLPSAVILFFGYLLQIPPVILALLMLLTPVGMLAWAYTRLTKRMKMKVEQAIIEEHGTDSPEFQEFKEHVKISENSVEGKQSRATLYVFLFSFVVMAFGVVLVGSILSSLNLPQESRENAGKIAQIIVLGGGLLFIMVGTGVVSNRAAKAAAKDAEAIDAAMKRADYETALKLVDATIERVPNWESRGPAAGVYQAAGKFEEAEKLIREALRELLERDEEKRKEMNPIISTYLGILGSILVARHRYEEADKAFERAIKLKSDFPHVYTNAAESLLFQGIQTEKALEYLEKASQLLKNPEQSTPSQQIAALVLKAWALARQGDVKGADALIQEALAQVDREHLPITASIYFYGGYVALAQRRTNAAQVSFNRAIKIDPNGMYGLLANEALESL
jgi:tetratricopeptide (TPR) repeat protein